MINNIINKLVGIDCEANNLVKFIKSIDIPPNNKILDVGCGFGKKIELLKSHGLNVIGIDVNPIIVRINTESGIKCITVDAFNDTTDMFDVILMSHIIEHFLPDELLKFMDNYLNRLNVGGYLIIATPLFSPYFYEDFDHVKPYHPAGISSVFGNNNSQVQYYSQNKIELVNIWFRKGPFKLIFVSGLYVKKTIRVSIIINTLLALLFRLSFGFVGRTDGWMGLYKKVSL